MDKDTTQPQEAAPEPQEFLDWDRMTEAEQAAYVAGYQTAQDMADGTWTEADYARGYRYI